MPLFLILSISTGLFFPHFKQYSNSMKNWIDTDVCLVEHWYQWTDGLPGLVNQLPTLRAEENGSTKSASYYWQQQEEHLWVRMGTKGFFIEKAAVYEGYERSPGSPLHTDEHCPSEELWPQSQSSQRGLSSHLARTLFHPWLSATKTVSPDRSTAKQRANLTRQSGSPPRHLAVHIVYWFLLRVIRRDWHSWLCLNEHVEGFGKRVSPVHSASLCSATV